MNGISYTVGMETFDFPPLKLKALREVLTDSIEVTTAYPQFPAAV